MAVPTKFIHFGCWNNLNEDKGNLRNVMKELETRVTEFQPNFIVIAGDNYYPNKFTIKDEEDQKIKKKIIIDQKLKDGFDLLPKDIEIDMIFGNHDLETNTKKPKLYLETLETVESDCHILQTELETSKGLKIADPTNPTTPKNIDLVMYKERYDENSSTLILMIDTTMYTEDATKVLPCYQKYLDVDDTTIDNVDKLKEYQLKKVIESIKEREKPIKNVILIGHHPIVGYKKKVKKDKTIVENVKDMPTFLPDLFEKIVVEIQDDSVKYYYLCADIHLYQHGTIKYKGKTIEQYIVGSGGTELDDGNFDSTPNTIFEKDIEYILHISNSVFGFLECTLENADTLSFKFHELQPGEEARSVVESTGGGKKSKRRTKKRKTRRNRKGKSKKSKR